MRATWTIRAATVFAAACAAALSLCAVASADNGPHVEIGPLGNATPDSCAMCHRAHTAQAPYLLKQSQEALCYSCHGSAGTGSNLDVADGVGYSGPGRSGAEGALRGGGFEYALIDSANPSGNGYVGEVPARTTGAAVTSAHSVNESSQMAWGNGAISKEPEDYGRKIKLTCGSCHDPHGNGMYRILRPIPTESGATTGVEIKEPKEMPHVYTTGNYWEVEDANDPSFIVNISAWCATCHTRLLAGTKSAITNSGDAVYAFRHRTNETSESSPTCIKCHVAHGTDATMGPYASAVPNPDGSAAGSASFLLRIDNRGVCQMCHNK